MATSPIIADDRDHPHTTAARATVRYDSSDDRYDVASCLTSRITGAVCRASVAVFERRPGNEPADGGDRGLQASTLDLLRERDLLDVVRQDAAAVRAADIAEFAGAPGEQAPPELAELVDSWGSGRLKGHFAMLPLMDRDGALSDVPVQLAVWQDKLVEVPGLT